MFTKHTHTKKIPYLTSLRYYNGNIIRKRYFCLYTLLLDALSSIRGSS